MSTNVSPKESLKKRKHKTYSPEFKLEAVRLAKEIGSSEASKKLSVSLSCIDKWKGGHAMKSTLSPELRALQEENKKLKKALEQEQLINAILKKTAAIFSKDHLT